MTRIDNFCDFLAAIFIAKVAKSLVTFWACVKTIAFYIKRVSLLFGQRFEKLGLLFIPTSGHTGWDHQYSW